MSQFQYPPLTSSVRVFVFLAADYIWWRYKLNAAIWQLVVEERKKDQAVTEELVLGE
jgi:hypothetical protein